MGHWGRRQRRGEVMVAAAYGAGVRARWLLRGRHARTAAVGGNVSSARGCDDAVGDECGGVAPPSLAAEGDATSACGNSKLTVMWISGRALA